MICGIGIDADHILIEVVVVDHVRNVIITVIGMEQSVSKFTVWERSRV